MKFIITYNINELFQECQMKVFRVLITFMFLFLSLPAFAEPVINVDTEDEIIVQPKQQKFFITGYGELHYNNIQDSNDKLELHRFVVGFNYDFTDRIRLRSEVEFEHGFSEQYIEFAYLDFDIVRWANLRVGSILMPIGYLNQNHEPTAYYSVERPDVYVRIIPTTWMEGGGGFWGEIVDGLNYQIYVHSSLNFKDGFKDDEGFSGKSGIRGGRGKVSDLTMNDIAGSARLQYTGLKAARFGFSAWMGNTAQGDARVQGGLVTLLEADAKFFFQGLELEGLVAVIFNPEAGDMTNALRADGNISATDVIGKRMFGFMIEGAYHVFHHAWKDAPVDLVVFVRYEKFDTQNQVPSGFAKNPAYDRQNVTFGLAFYPIDNIVFKADYAVKSNDAGTGNNQFNLGVGYYF